MAPHPAPSSIGRCSAASRSFLRGPDGPAGTPPGHSLRSGAYMAASRKRDHNKISPIKVSTLSGEPRSVAGVAVSVFHPAISRVCRTWMALAIWPARQGQQRSLRKMAQVLSWALARSPGARSLAWAELAAFWEAGLFRPR